MLKSIPHQLETIFTSFQIGRIFGFPVYLLSQGGGRGSGRKEEKNRKINHFLCSSILFWIKKYFFNSNNVIKCIRKLHKLFSAKWKAVSLIKNFDRQDFLLFVCSSDLDFGNLTYPKLNSVLEGGPVIHLHLNHHITNFILSHNLWMKSFSISKIRSFCSSCHVVRATLVHFKDHSAQDKITCSGLQHSFCHSRHFIS